MNVNPRYSCLALSGVFQLPSTERTIVVRSNSNNNEQNISTVTPWIMYRNTSGYSLLREIEIRLKTAYDTLWSNTSGDFEVYLNEACRIVIRNNSPSSIALVFNSSSFTLKRFLGTALNVQTSIPANGGELEMEYQPPYLWCPHMFTSVDVGADRILKMRSQSMTHTKRPRLVSWSTEKRIREYAWETIAAPFIIEGYSGLADFAASAGVTLNDPNCSFDTFMRYLDGSDSTGTVFPYPRQVVIIRDYDTMNEVIDPTLGTKRWWVVLDDDYMKNVSSSARFDGSALESYRMNLTLRRVE